MSIEMIAAVAENGVIGKGGKMLWQLKTDRLNVRKLVRNSLQIAGRKTHQSLLHCKSTLPLESDGYAILSKSTNPEYGFEILTSIEEVIKIAESRKVCVIGGAEVYRAMLPYATKIYLTIVHAKIWGDAYFPKINRDEWKITSAVRYK